MLLTQVQQLPSATTVGQMVLQMLVLANMPVGATSKPTALSDHPQHEIVGLEEGSDSASIIGGSLRLVVFAVFSIAMITLLWWVAASKKRKLQHEDLTNKEMEDFRALKAKVPRGAYKNATGGWENGGGPANDILRVVVRCDVSSKEHLLELSHQYSGFTASTVETHASVVLQAWQSIKGEGAQGSDVAYTEWRQQCPQDAPLYGKLKDVMARAGVASGVSRDIFVMARGKPVSDGEFDTLVRRHNVCAAVQDQKRQILQQIRLHDGQM